MVTGVRFEWDEAKNIANQRKHGVSFEEARLVFDDPLYVPSRIGSWMGSSAGRASVSWIGICYWQSRTPFAKKDGMAMRWK